jgi:diacylglycerol O-acyltransferase 2, plant
VILCVFAGRWGLPIPYRTPMMGVAGNMIIVNKIENPTKEDIEKLLCILEERIKETFDNHKAAYGWENVELIIK